MLIEATADIHNQGKHVRLKGADLLLIAGDVSSRGTITEITAFNEWCGKVQCKYTHGVAMTPGNHDWLFQDNEPLARETMTNALVLIDEMIEIEGIRIYGSPWQPEFGNWAYNLPRGDKLKMRWDMIPDGPKRPDILLVHSPAHEILDTVPQRYAKRVTKEGINPRGDIYHSHHIEEYNFDKHVGCWDLRQAINRVKPQVVIHGHIHCSYGSAIVDGVTYRNVAACNEAYDPVNPTQLFEIFPSSNDKSFVS
jgi:Icc-related predicted phosphoesterase